MVQSDLTDAVNWPAILMVKQNIGLSTRPNPIGLIFSLLASICM